MIRARKLLNHGTTKGSIIHRGYKISFKTKERDGLWQCSARCTTDKGSFVLTVFDSESLISGFASKEGAEKATLDAMKDWIDTRSNIVPIEGRTANQQKSEGLRRYVKY